MSKLYSRVETSIFIGRFDKMQLTWFYLKENDTARLFNENRSQINIYLYNREQNLCH